jgi:hypothetical protein
VPGHAWHSHAQRARNESERATGRTEHAVFGPTPRRSVSARLPMSTSARTPPAASPESSDAPCRPRRRPAGTSGSTCTPVNSSQHDADAQAAAAPWPPGWRRTRPACCIDDPGPPRPCGTDSQSSMGSERRARSLAACTRSRPTICRKPPPLETRAPLVRLVPRGRLEARYAARTQLRRKARHSEPQCRACVRELHPA